MGNYQGNYGIAVYQIKTLKNPLFRGHYIITRWLEWSGFIGWVRLFFLPLSQLSLAGSRYLTEYQPEN